MRTTIPKTGNQSAHGSYGPRSHPPQVTGSRQNQPMVEKRGKRIGYRTSNECNSWRFRDLRGGISAARRLNNFSIFTVTSRCRNSMDGMARGEGEAANVH